MAKAENYKISGVVNFCGKSDDDKTVVTLLLTEERAKELIEKLKLDDFKYDSTPVKETEKGELIFKTSSKYPVTIYDDGAETKDVKLEDIGKGSEVTLFVGVGEASFKKKTFQVAYLKSINVTSLEEHVPFNPFDSDDVKEA